MEREAFEQLVSQWLDQPDRADLRERIDLAVAADPELRALLDEWLRLDRVIRAAAHASHTVDWGNFRERIQSGIDETSAEERIERRIQEVTDISRRVDWNRLHERITQAVHEERTTPLILRIPRRVTAAVSILAAAAAIVMMLTLPQPLKQSSPSTRGIARVAVSSAAEKPLMLPYAQTVGVKRSEARVSVSALAEGEAVVAADSPNLSRKSVHSMDGEMFLMVEPIQVAINAPGSLSPFELN